MFVKFKKFVQELDEAGFILPELDSSNPFGMLKVTMERFVGNKTFCVTLNQEGFVIKDTDIIGVGYCINDEYFPIATLEGISNVNNITTQEILDLFKTI